jgi:hypothetical protein
VAAGERLRLERPHLLVGRLPRQPRGAAVSALAWLPVGHAHLCDGGDPGPPRRAAMGARPRLPVGRGHVPQRGRQRCAARGHPPFHSAVRSRVVWRGHASLFLHRCCPLSLSWARAGQLGVLQWARANGCDWDAGVCAAAARGGHLAELRWARANGCDWDADTCNEAACGGCAFPTCGRGVGRLADICPLFYECDCALCSHGKHMRSIFPFGCCTTLLACR